MSTRLTAVVVDTPDPRRLARWWGGALGWPVGYEDDDETEIVPPEGAPGVPVTFVPVADPKVTQNRVHLDLSSADDAAQRATVERLLAAGARHADVGQGETPFVVLADPDGNEFCVLEPRPQNGDTGAVDAIVVQAQDPVALAAFWSAASGLPEFRRIGPCVELRAPDGRGPFLDFVPVEHPHRVKNRVHLDVAPYAADDQDAEVERLIALGARRIDVGQSQARPGAVTWQVLADPEGNEFCVLSPRGAPA